MLIWTVPRRPTPLIFDEPLRLNADPPFFSTLAPTPRRLFSASRCCDSRPTSPSGLRSTPPSPRPLIIPLAKYLRSKAPRPSRHLWRPIKYLSFSTHLRGLRPFCREFFLPALYNRPLF